MNNYLEAGAITKYEKKIIEALENTNDVMGLVASLRAFDLSLADSRILQCLSNVTQTVALSEDDGLMIDLAVAMLS